MTEERDHHHRHVARRRAVRAVHFRGRHPGIHELELDPMY
jgi:hypothetical protein